MSPAPATIRDHLRDAEAALEAAGVAESVADARLLLAHALGSTTTWLFTHPDDPVPPAAGERFRAFVERRARREPLQHVIGEQEFWSLRFEVGPDVLIPRPDTEVLVEAVLEPLQALSRPRVADIGTGSGAVAIALASELPRARLTAVDVSPAALEIARRNARLLGYEDRIDFVQGHLVEPLAGLPPFDAVVANLPYVRRADWEQLEREVRDHEPKLALVGGEEGTELLLELAREAPAVLAPAGLLALEVGYDQAPAVRVALERLGYGDIRTRRDFADIERVVVARRPVIGCR